MSEAAASSSMCSTHRALSRLSLVLTIASRLTTVSPSTPPLTTCDLTTYPSISERPLTTSPTSSTPTAGGSISPSSTLPSPSPGPSHPEPTVLPHVTPRLRHARPPRSKLLAWPGPALAGLDRQTGRDGPMALAGRAAAYVAPTRRGRASEAVCGGSLPPAGAWEAAGGGNSKTLRWRVVWVWVLPDHKAGMTELLMAAASQTFAARSPSGLAGPYGRHVSEASYRRPQRRRRNPIPKPPLLCNVRRRRSAAVCGVAARHSSVYVHSAMW